MRTWVIVTEYVEPWFDSLDDETFEQILAALTLLTTSGLPIGQHSPGFIAATDDEAKNLMFPHYQVMHERIGRTRGWPPLTRAQFEHEAGPEGALFAGSPETVARKLARSIHGLGISRFDLKYSLGTLPHEHLMESIRLYGEVVVPRVRELLEVLENETNN